MVAPLVGALLKAGLPLIADVLADKGKQWVEDKTGIKLPDISTPVLTSDQIVVLQKAQMEHEEFLLNHALQINQQKLDEKKMELADVDSARKMQMTALQGQDEFSKRFVYWFAAASLAVSTVYIFWITFGEVPDKNTRFADTILGFLLGTVLAQILNFFFGTSRSSEKNGDAVRQVATQVLDKGENK